MENEDTKLDKILNTAACIIMGSAVLYLAVYHLKSVMSDGDFHTIPEVRRLDSSYQSQTRAYHMQIDSLKKVYKNNLENKVEGK